MKCPKCGSEYKTGGTDVNGNAVCKACQLKELKDLGFLNDKDITQTTSSNKLIIETELTPAEMLLWLAENEIIDIWHTVPPKSNIRTTFVGNSEGIIYVWRNGNAVKFKDKTLIEAIIKAYEWAAPANDDFIAGVVAELNETLPDAEQLIANKRERDKEISRLLAMRKWFKTTRTLYFNFHKDLWDVDKPDGTYGLDYTLVRSGVIFLFQESDGKYVGHTATTQTNFVEFSSEEAMRASGWFEEVCNEGVK